MVPHLGCYAGVIKTQTAEVSTHKSGEELSAYFSTAVFQQDVDVLLVLKMVIKMHNVSVMQQSM